MCAGIVPLILIVFGTIKLFTVIFCLCEFVLYFYLLLYFIINVICFYFEENCFLIGKLCLQFYMYCKKVINMELLRSLWFWISFESDKIWRLILICISKKEICVFALPWHFNNYIPNVIALIQFAIFIIILSYLYSVFQSKVTINYIISSAPFFVWTSFLNSIKAHWFLYFIVDQTS